MCKRVVGFGPMKRVPKGEGVVSSSELRVGVEMTVET